MKTETLNTEQQEIESVVMNETEAYDENQATEEAVQIEIPSQLLVGPADDAQLKRIIEGAIMAASEPLSLANIQNIFELSMKKPSTQSIKDMLAQLQAEYAERGVELKEVASGYRFQARDELAPWITRLWQERPPRYSRAVLETLAIIAYRQPATRAEIEEIRGVAVSSNIVKILIERGWVNEVGHKEAPGRPALLATTQAFLDYFNLKKLTDLPSLAEIKDLDALEEKVEHQLELDLAITEDGVAAEIVDAVVDSDEITDEVDATIASVEQETIISEIDFLDNEIEADTKELEKEDA